MASAEFAGKEYTVYRTINGAITAAPAKLPALGPKDVLLRVTHSGVCYTDLEFSRAGAPLALGHEGAGVVEAVGSDVTALRPGDRAGGGFHRASCGRCAYCLSGRDILCHERVIYGEGDFDNGSFAPFYVGKETYLHRIPDGMGSAEAAPLQCAGATVYAALAGTVGWGPPGGRRVGVVGIGGLGHLAVQFAAKMGAEVVVFSSSADKESEARGLGAAEFVLMAEPDKVRAPVQTLVIAGNRYPDWSKFMVKEVLARDGTIIPLSAPVSGPLSLPADRMFWDMFHVHSSLVASRQVHDDMLEFAALHGVKPVLEVYKHEGPETITEIFERLKAGKVRYRAVLEF
ncbi:GroES-like protein [Pleurostoma richardsiae]|uniref:GroES-like protein n=1 Tax=Pleurostoma richardsiae TaxID=41990 RepID=A0AA38VIM7_9PEZI|nr:GroES-like protein [Pleurostoma richardsiae]